MKRVLLFIVVLLVLMCGVAVATGMLIIDSGDCGSGVTWILDSAGTLTISGKGGIMDFFPPTGIFSPWYSSRTSIKDVVIEEGVVAIGDYAFYGCCNLASINIPNSMKYIDYKAFEGCVGLSKIYAGSLENWLKISFVDSLTSTPLYYGGELYIDDELVTDLDIPNGITYINNGFSGCSSLTSLIIPDSVTFICEGAFRGCSNLRSIVLPDGLKTIKDNTFNGCSSLCSITILNNVTTIGESAFENCSSLSSIILPDSVTTIDYSAFNGCSSLRSIELPGNVTIIDYNTFNGCSSLSSIKIPDGVTTIAAGAFRGCSSLSSITIPKSLTTIKSGAFEDCISLSKVYVTSLESWLNISFGQHSNGSSSPLNCGGELYIAGNLLTDLVLPDGITQIGNCAFCGCASLVSISIPESVTSIGEDAFRGCSSLSSITIPEGVTSIGDGAFSDCSSLSSITIPEGVTSIGRAAFRGCSSLSSITIPDSVTSIGNDAFSWCSSLRSITLPEGVTSIGNDTFWNCSSLSSITIPAGVTSIGDSAFFFCSNLRKIMFMGNDMPTLGSRVFYVVPTIYCHKGSEVEDWAMTNWYTIVYLEDHVHSPVTDPAVPATHVTTGLTEGSHCEICGEVLVAQQSVPVVEVSEIIALPAELKTIEAEAFAGDTFACVVLPDGCEAIGAGAFKDCAQLRFIEIPRSVEYIDGSAFAGCSDSLIIVTVPSSAALCFAQEKGITYVLR